MFTESWSSDQVMQRASYVTVLDSSKCACSHQRWYRCQSLLRFYVVGQKWLEDATCGRGFVWKRRKELSVFKQKRLCVERALVFNGTEESLIAWIISLSPLKRVASWLLYYVNDPNMRFISLLYLWLWSPPIHCHEIFVAERNLEAVDKRYWT